MVYEAPANVLLLFFLVPPFVFQLHQTNVISPTYPASLCLCAFVPALTSAWIISFLRLCLAIFKPQFRTISWKSLGTPPLPS